MLSKILTFAISLRSPISDKDAIKKILVDRNYLLKYYEYGKMITYSKDGKPLKTPDVPILGENRENQYQLRGKHCVVDFSSDNPTILCQFGIKPEQVIYDFAKNMQEIQSVIKILNQFTNYDVSPCELLVAIGVKGKQNSAGTILALQKTNSEIFEIKDLNEIIPKNFPLPKPSEADLSRLPPPSPADNLEIHYKSDLNCKSKNTESIIRARDGKYTITLRFESIGADNLLSDLQNCEQFGLEIVEKLEMIGRLD
jgi:hypothetical protein